MSKTTIEKIIESEIINFRAKFVDSSRNIFTYNEKLIHPGEFGVNREVETKKFIRHFINPEYIIGTGFISSKEGINSHQCDIVISHKSFTPLIKDLNNAQFYTPEAVVGIGEIKSVLTKSELKKALMRLSKAKELRNLSINKQTSIVKKRMLHHTNHYDLPVTFLICEKLDFNLDNFVEEINELYKDIKAKYKHNFILSLKDGLFTYFTATENNNTVTVQYPVLDNIELK